MQLDRPYMPKHIPIDPDTIVRRSREIIFSRLDDELLAIHSEGGLCYSLNESAASVWENMKEAIAVRELCSRMRATYAVNEQVCMSDVLEILSALNDAGLVEVVDAPAD